MTSIFPPSLGLSAGPSSMRLHDPTWKMGRGGGEEQDTFQGSGKMHKTDTVFISSYLNVLFIPSVHIQQAGLQRSSHTEGHSTASTLSRLLVNMP